MEGDLKIADCVLEAGATLKDTYSALSEITVSSTVTYLTMI